MELITGFVIVSVIALWTLGIPITLIIIAVNLSGTRKAQEYIAEAAYRIETTYNAPLEAKED